MTYPPPTMVKTVALLVGRERTFPDALIDAIRKRGAGIDAGYASLDITPVEAPPPYAVIVDRISHDVPCFQPVLKCMALQGTHVINNPFWRIADDKAFGTALAARLGVPVPRTFILPSKEYGEDINAASLHSLRYPLDWGSLPFPLYIKPHWGGGFRDVYRVTSLEDLWRTYDRTGRLTMIAQESIEWEQYIRCVVIGRDNVLPLLWDPRLPHHERYLGASSTMPALSPELRDRVVDHARSLCHALGYEMNTCEFAVRDGVPYAIDFMNSAPDFEGRFLGDEAFSWIVDQMASLCVRLADTPARTPLRWDAFLSGS
jgi:hypothetical protein